MQDSTRDLTSRSAAPAAPAGERADAGETAGDAAAGGWTAAGQAAPVLDWLQTRGRALEPAALLEGLCLRLRDVGVPLARATLHVLTLHPQVRAVSQLWTLAGTGVESTDRLHGVEHTSTYLQSPLRRVFEGGTAIRRRLVGPNATQDFPILQDLAEQGLTDYLVLPLGSSAPRPNVVSLASDHPAGFSPLALATIDAVLPVLGLVVELQAARRVTRVLLDTYVGPHAARRVLEGRIQRGPGETLRAVIWICDLRGFTELSDTRPTDEVIELLNGYFNAMAGPVTAAGGEILKFIGDAMLAIVPVDEANRSQDACGAALRAARGAVANMATLNRARLAGGQEALRFGIGLHLGEVFYGNIGAPDRLDFTVVGPAVNLTARLEHLTDNFATPVVASSAFAAASPEPLVSLGVRRLRGVRTPQEVFGLG